jgi:hypothetical protein
MFCSFVYLVRCHPTSCKTVDTITQRAQQAGFGCWEVEADQDVSNKLWESEDEAEVKRPWTFS